MQQIKAKIAILDKFPLAHIPKTDEQRAFKLFAEPSPSIEQAKWNDAMFCAESIVEGGWGIALHWCIKMRYKLTKHKIPGRSYEVMFFKDLGAFIRSILELTLQCDVHQLSRFGRSCADPLRWFNAIVRELVLIDKQALSAPWSKREALNTERLKIKAIRAGTLMSAQESAICQQMASETPLFYDLLKTSQKLLARDSSFERLYMTGKGNRKDKYPHIGLLEAWRRWIATQDRPQKKQPKCGAMWVQEDKILIQTGKGRNVTHLLPVMAAKTAKNRS
jgi:hypothetical protein